MQQPDLNFLYVLQALADERSVSRAADRLGLTQPAVSHALGKLRVLFQDDLFVRAGSVMAPTPVGERLIEGVTHALAVIQQEIWSAKSFDATTTTRTFSVCLSDMGVIVLLPRLLAALRERAPLASLRPIQLPSLELASALQDGAIDLAIGYLGKLGDNLHQQPLFHRSLVGIVKGGTKRKKVSMTLEQFIGRKHVVAGTLALTNQLLEKELRRLGARLNVGVDVPSAGCSKSGRDLGFHCCRTGRTRRPVLAACGCGCLSTADKTSRPDRPGVLARPASQRRRAPVVQGRRGRNAASIQDVTVNASPERPYDQPSRNRKL